MLQRRPVNLANTRRDAVVIAFALVSGEAFFNVVELERADDIWMAKRSAFSNRHAQQLWSPQDLGKICIK